MYPDLNGKTALVTGASKGIGAAIARRLADEGCDTILTARSQADLLALQMQIERETATKSEIILSDLSQPGAAGRIAAAFPAVDILINNAGEDPVGSLLEIDEERWAQAWALKGFGYINMCREYYKRMAAQGGGVIINIIGIAHFFKEPAYIFGAANTASLNVFTQTLGRHSLKDNIRVLAINPGITATERLIKGRQLGDELRTRGGEADAAPDAAANLSQFADEVAHGLGAARGGRPSEIAAAVAFAASAQASYVTGVALNVDGGVSRN